MKAWMFCCSLGLSILSGIYAAVHGEGRVTAAAGLGGVTSTSKPQCINFTAISSHQGQFSSPFYPKIYPNNTDCTHVIEAPYHQRIRIDFRGEFHIEVSPTEGCQYDYLELRDGPFGYSPLIGRYCGQKYPSMIDSSGRYIWMRFQSDNNIEYMGFKAVYEFYQQDNPGNYPAQSYPYLCRFDMDTSQLEVKLSSEMVHTKLDEIQMYDSHQTEVDCTFVLNASAGSQIFLHWQLYKMEDHDDCDDSFISVYEGTTKKEHRTKKLCGEIAKDFRTDKNLIYLRVFGKTWQHVPTFTALVTVPKKGQCDASSMFKCGGDICIDQSLRCNGNVNCEDSMDELACYGTEVHEEDTDTGKKEKPLMSTFHIIILSVVGSVILSIILVSTYVSCKQHNKEQQRRKHALRQERQAIEHEMTTLINSPRPGHLRSPQQTAVATQGKPNGSIPGTSRNGNGGSIHSGDVKKTPGQHGMYIENHIGQNPGHLSNGGNGYTRYLKIKDNKDEGCPAHDVVIANKDYCDNSQIPWGSDCLERSRLRRTLSDKVSNHRSRTPSPRPDVVQVERVRQHINHQSKHLRALSADRLLGRHSEDTDDRQRRALCGDRKPYTPPSAQSEFYLPYKCSDNPSGYGQNCHGRDVNGRSPRQARMDNGRDPSPYSASDCSPRLSHPLQQQHKGNAAGQYINLDPGYRATVTELRGNKDKPVNAFCNPINTERVDSPSGMCTKSGGCGTESASSAGSVAYAPESYNPSSCTSSFHSPTHSHIVDTEQCSSSDRQNMLHITDPMHRVSRTPSIDYKQAPIVPERGNSSSNTSGQNYATVHTKQGRNRKTDSPDMFYTRPKRSEVRHEPV